MLRYILQTWTWYAQDLLARFLPYDMENDRTKGPLFNVNANGRRRDHIGVQYSPTVASEADEVLLAGDTFVKRVEWWKRDKWPWFHEFLVFYVEERVSNGETPRKSVFRVDRNGEDVIADKAEPVIDGSIDLCFYKDPYGIKAIEPPAFPGHPPPRPTSLFVLPTAAEMKRKKRPLSAADGITFSTDGTDAFIKSDLETKYRCRALNIHGDYLSVPEALILARVVHDHHRTYELLQYQCYWYSEIIYTTIKRLIDDAAKKMALETSGQQSISSLYKEDINETTLLVGQFQFVTEAYYVRRGKADTPEKVYAEYLEAWDDAKKTIALRVERRDAGKRALQEAKQALEEETERRMTAEQETKATEKKAKAEVQATEEKAKAEVKAAEEKARATEEKARATEEKARATEEKAKAEVKAAEETARKLAEEFELFKRQYAAGPSAHRTSATHVAS